METGYTKSGENIYFRCRKEAASSNPAVSSREKAAELLGISASTLANYELGVTKFVPVDIIVRMAELYNAPELKHAYCAHECPIGKGQPIAVEITSIERIALRLLKTMDDESIRSFRESLVEVALHGPDESEVALYEAMVDRIDEIMVVLSELRMLAEKTLKG